jgi:two-component system nitrogen regulation response regulator NtrX
MATVLVVEDNADLREMYAQILEMTGHEVVSAETAAEALVAIPAKKPEVAVLDLGVAGGVDAVVEALRTPPAAGLILASGAPDLAERAAAVHAAWLLKPFGPEVLVEAVERALAVRVPAPRAAATSRS